MLFYFISILFFFFFNDTATTEIYTLSLHDALPISFRLPLSPPVRTVAPAICRFDRSEEHTSELQSRGHLVCRLLLEKKKTQKIYTNNKYKKLKKTSKYQKQNDT